MYLKEQSNISPNDVYESTVKVPNNVPDYELKLSVHDENGRELVAYQGKKPEIEQIPEAAQPLSAPEEIKSNEELFLAGLHLEQYRHATYEPEAYYLEGLKRDPGDIRLNVAFGTLLLRRGCFQESEQYFRKAVERLSWKNANPYDSEPYYQLGMSLKLQGRLEEAFDVLYKSVWSAAWQDGGYFTLAQIASERGLYEEALELVERSIIRNTRNYRSRGLKSAMLRKLGRYEEAKAVAEETIHLDVANFTAYFELKSALIQMGCKDQAQLVEEQLVRLMRDDPHNYVSLASDYVDCGLFEEAAEVLNGLIYYALGYVQAKLGEESASRHHLQAGSAAPTDYCFPNSLFELRVLEYAVMMNPEDAKAHYYIGNLLYDKKRPQDAIQHWERSRELDDTFSIVHRNLALAYYNKMSDPEAARDSMERAFTCDGTDARVFYERWRNSSEFWNWIRITRELSFTLNR